MALVAKDSEQITVDATAGGKGFTAAKAVPEGGAVIMAFCKVETAAIRINPKNAPVAGGAEGSPLMNPGDEFEVWGYSDLKNFKAIRETATSGLLNVLYFGQG